MGSSLALPYVYSWCDLPYGIQNNILYFLFSRSHPNHTYHFCNSSLYHPSHYGTASYVSPSESFAWSRPVHSTSRHTPTTMTCQAKAQISAPMSSTQQIMNSMVTCSYFPHVTCVAYDKQLLHASKEDVAILVSYIYNSQDY
jgi:hypothetical protein